MLLFFVLFIQAQALTFSEAAVSSQWNSVVAITTDGKDSENELVNSYCVATFINPHILVTAAHCVSHAYLLNSNKIKIDIGQYEYRTRPDGSVFRLGYITQASLQVGAQFYFNQNLLKKLKAQKFSSKISPDEDLALIKIDQPMLTPLEFIQPLRDQDLSAIKKNIVNYKPSVVTINFIAEMSLDTKRAAELNDLKATGSSAWRSQSESRVEPGDSGAPLFIRTTDKWYLIGVVKGQAKTMFSNWDVFASFEKNFCQISKTHSLELCR